MKPTRVRCRLTAAFAALVLLRLSTAGAHAATATCTIPAGQRGYWTNDASWNAAPYPGSGAGETANINAARTGSYTNILNKTPLFPLTAVNLANSSGQAWLIVTNGTLPEATLTVGGGGRLRVDSGGTLTNSTTFRMNGADGRAYIQSGGKFFGGATFDIGYLANGNLFSMRGGSARSGGAVYIGRRDASGVTAFNSMTLEGGASFNAGAQTVYIGGARYIAEKTHTNSLVINGSVLTNAGAVYVANNSAIGNALSLTNGGRLFSTAGSFVGWGAQGPTFGNRVLVTGGAGVTSSWNMGAQSLSFGVSYGSNNTIVVDGKGTYGSAALANLGVLTVASSGNLMLLTNRATFASASGNVTLGGSFNRIEVVQGSSFAFNAAGATALSLNGTAGTLLVRGTNSVLAGLTPGANATHLVVGSGATRNTLRVENGGVVTNLNVAVGSGANSRANIMRVTAGGRIYSSTLGSSIGVGTSSTLNTGLVSGAGSVWNLGNQMLSVGNSGRTNDLWIADGGTVTNSSGVYVGGTYNAGSSTYYPAYFNRLIVTNGGRLFSALGMIGQSGVTGGGKSNSNTVEVTGSGSLWDMRGGDLTVGQPTYIGNTLTLNRSGSVENVATLTIHTNNFVYLRGGTVAAAAVVVNNGRLLSVGDGAQPAAFVARSGGTCNFKNGLWVRSGAALRGAGTVDGGSPQIVITNGATFAGGITGPGTLALKGTVWCGGATNHVRIADVSGAPGVGYGYVNLIGQPLTLRPDGRKHVIRMDSMGDGAGFDSNQNYYLKIIEYGSVSGFSVTNFTIDLSAFAPGGSWALTNIGSALYLSYQGAIPIVPDWTWNAPASGNWGTSGKWIQPGTPAAGGAATYTLEFGGSGAAGYASTNDLGNNFRLNRIVLTSGSTGAGVVRGQSLLFTNANAGVVQRGNGAFSFANRLGWKGPFGVSGYAPGTLTFADVLAGTGAVTIAGAHTTVFSAANTFAGSVFVGTRGMGKLRVDHASGLGTNSVSVTNGTLHVNVTPFRFGDTNHRNRRGVVTGSLSLWTNSGSLYIGGAAGATSNIVLVTAAGTLRAPTLYVGNGSRGHSSLTVSNGAQVAVGTVSIGASSTNNGILVTGAGTVFAMEGTSAGAMGGLRSQVRVEGGAAINNANIYVPAFRMAATAISNSVVVANGGVINSSVDAGGLQGAVLVTGSGSRITAGGIVGYNGGTRNELRVESGGSVVGPIRVGGYYAASPLCRAVVDNATVSGGGVYVGTGRDTDGPGGPAGTRDCELVVTNGGQVTASSSGVYIGGYYVQGSYAHYAGPSTNNFIRVFGGSTLRCGPAGTPGPLLVGYYHKSRGNELRVTGGTVTNVSVLDVGSLTTNIGNSVTISGGGRLTLDSASGARIGAGNGSTSNSIAVSDGGVLNARGYPITIGVGSGTWGNSLIAAGGGLGGSE